MKNRLTPFLFIAILLLSSCLGYKVNPRKAYTKALKNKPYDAIIVPGVPFVEEKGKWDDIMKARVYWSKYLYDNGFAKNIIYSGSAVYTPFIESKIMKLYAIELGIPEDAIQMDSLAEHSSENLWNSTILASKFDWDNVAIATDPIQSGILSPFAKSLDINVDAVPIVWKIIFALGLENRPDPEIDYEQARVKDFQAITEREGFLKRFKGTQGRFIKHDIYRDYRPAMRARSN